MVVVPLRSLQRKTQPLKLCFPSFSPSIESTCPPILPSFHPSTHPSIRPSIHPSVRHGSFPSQVKSLFVLLSHLWCIHSVTALLCRHARVIPLQERKEGKKDCHHSAGKNQMAPHHSCEWKEKKLQASSALPFFIVIFLLEKKYKMNHFQFFYSLNRS